jgi:hypothetical protein
MSHPRFSRRTLIAALELIEVQLTHAQLTRFVLKLGPDFSRWLPASGSLADRTNTIISLVDQRPDRRTEGGDFLTDVIVAHAVELLPRPRRTIFGEEGKPQPLHPLVAALRVDGYAVEGGILVPQLPVSVVEEASADSLSSMLRHFEFGVAAGHLTQALDAHSRGDWASANAQLRTFFDALLEAMCLRVGGTAETGQAARTKLASMGYLQRELNEWTDDGRGYVNGLILRLHTQGPHPGLSDEVDSTFRLQTVVLMARMLLLRLKSRSE